ncbi:MAG: hypothetical protein AAGF72_05265, partial [Pseudomonadota bacterium]
AVQENLSTGSYANTSTILEVKRFSYYDEKLSIHVVARYAKRQLDRGKGRAALRRENQYLAFLRTKRTDQELAQRRQSAPL